VVHNFNRALKIRYISFNLKSEDKKS